MNLPKTVANMRYHYHLNMIDVCNALNQLHLMSDEKAENRNKNHVMIIFNDCLPRLGKDMSFLKDDEENETERAN